MLVCVYFTVTRGWISNYARDGLFQFLIGVNETKKRVSELYALPGLMCQAISITMIHVDTVI